MNKKSLIYLMIFVPIGLLYFYSCSNNDDDCTEQTWYQDSDADEFGNQNISQQSCNQPSGYVIDNTDFDDNNSTAYPNATELCNGIDNNGNGTIDEDTINCAVDEVCENGACVTAVMYYRDSDGDGYGDSNDTIIAGSIAPTGYVLDNTDCNDTETSINPGASEIPNNNVDDNCNGIVDGCTSNTACDDGDTSTYDVCIDEVCYHYTGSQCNDNTDCAEGQTCVDIGGGISICQ